MADQFGKKSQVVSKSEKEVSSHENDDCDRNPSPPPSLFENEDAVADTISGTIVSKKWALETLLETVKEVENSQSTTRDQSEDTLLELNEALESEICKLWDMSMGNAVAKFLIEVDAPATLLAVINKSRAPRLTEICVGILGNLMCIPDICQTLSSNSDLRKVILLLLDYPDPPTLVETTRLLNVCITTNPASKPWLTAIKSDNTILGKLSFVLESSTNIHLLKNMADLLDNLLDVDEQLCATWSSRELVAGVLEAMKQIGKSVPETRDTYCHILQVISTTSEGSKAIGHNSDTVLKLIHNRLREVCEDDFVDFSGQQCGLASAVAVLIVVCNQGKGKQFLERERSVLKYILHLLSAVHHDKKRRQSESEERGSTSSSDVVNTTSSVPTLNSVLMGTLMAFWSHVIQDMSLPPFVLDTLDKSPEKYVKALLEELKVLSEDDFDYIEYLKNRVEDTGQYNRLSELVGK